jgi:hypothetical protein
MTELLDASCFRFDHYVKEDQAFSHQGVTPYMNQKQGRKSFTATKLDASPATNLAGGSRYWRPRDRSHTDDRARRELSDL